MPQNPPKAEQLLKRHQLPGIYGSVPAMASGAAEAHFWMCAFFNSFLFLHALGPGGALKSPGESNG
jgi:hypothetical protein